MDQKKQATEKEGTKSKSATVTAITTICSILLALIVGVSLYSVFKKNIRVQYTSVDHSLMTVTVNVKLESEERLTINSSDFAIMSEGMPLNASTIICEEEGVDGDIFKTNGATQTIKVIFKVNYNDVDKPIKVLFMGKELKLNSSTGFKI